MSANYLPIEIVMNILPRLPVKSILRFKCVCKCWFDFISNPNFVNMHMDHAVANRSELYMVLISDNRRLMFSSLDYSSSSSPSLITCYDQTFDRFESILGSCNGLLCIGYISRYEPSLQISLIFLWNPSTTEYKEIPSLSIHSVNDFFVKYTHDLQANSITRNLKGQYRDIGFGFGYDCKIDDYKLIRVESFCAYSCQTEKNIGLGCEVNVYTLRMNSWKHIPSSFPYNMDTSDGVFVNGALHWTASHWIGGSRASSSKVIVSFDFEEEKFIEISTLEHFDINLGHLEGLLIVGHLGGCLSLSVVHYGGSIEVWVMKDYGVRESWTKLFAINERQSLVGYFLEMMPIHSFKNGEILLSRSTYYDSNSEYALALYDPKHESLRTLKNIHNGDKWSSSGTYQASLVSLNTGTYMSQIIQSLNGGGGGGGGGYGYGYGGSSLGDYRGEPSLGYSSCYGGGFGRGYGSGGGYGGPSEGYGGYSDGYGSSLYGNRGGYGGGRYHPYAR